jgi:AbrB family looped-hinge helix DNA binding protein
MVRAAEPDRDARSDDLLHERKRAKPSSPTDGEKWGCANLPHMSRFSGTARLDERGRLVLPAEMRRRMGLRAGDEVRISEEADGALRVESRRAAARALIGLAGSSAESVVEELRAERRREAAAEDRDAQQVRGNRGVRPRR